MASILPFVPKGAQTRKPVPHDGSSAVIIIFPGVRYERPPSDTASSRPVKRGKRARSQ